MDASLAVVALVAMVLGEVVALRIMVDIVVMKMRSRRASSCCSSSTLMLLQVIDSMIHVVGGGCGGRQG